ncbi:glycoside hydrolase family 12 protein [Imleria badia]|nr:glycoside hydrolase family 12 protein [Imleria badia]
MISGSWSALLLLLPLVSVSAATTICGQYDTVTSGSYSMFNNLWGERNATSGSQCSTLESVDGNTVTWYTTWTWVGGSSIKSYSNVQQNTGVNQQLSAITSMQSTWDWSQSDTAVTADVAYDLFTSNTAGGSAVNELMIWLANFNSGPISYHYNSNGAIPAATNLAIAGHSWDFYSGDNGSNKVFSFLLVGGTVTSFSGDIHEFFTYLINNGYVDASQYLTTAQAGTEATTGSATLTTSAYSLTIN